VWLVWYTKLCSTAQTPSSENPEKSSLSQTLISKPSAPPMDDEDDFVHKPDDFLHKSAASRSAGGNAAPATSASIPAVCKTTLAHPASNPAVEDPAWTVSPPASKVAFQGATQFQQAIQPEHAIEQPPDEMTDQ
jgi:hypothetical protein